MARTKGKPRTGELPEDFVERLQRFVPPSELRTVISSFAARPTTFRINTILADEAVVLEELKQQGFKVKRVSWLREAFILDSRTKRELTNTELYTSGKIYLQSLASMIPVLALDPQPGESICDLTAAPGSKTSQIAARMRRQGKLLANEKNHVRFFKLLHNMKLLGVTNETDNYCSLRKEDGSRIAREHAGTFDRVLLDAPCSGEARFVVGEPESFGYWSERKIDECVQLQRRLTIAALRLVRVGGLVVYSTCTLAPEENELVLEYTLKRTALSDGSASIQIEPWSVAGLRTLPSAAQWGQKVVSASARKGTRLFPTADIEPFFVAKIRKLTDLPPPPGQENEAEN